MCHEPMNIRILWFYGSALVQDVAVVTSTIEAAVFVSQG